MSNLAIQPAASAQFTGRERLTWWLSTMGLGAFYGVFAILHFQDWAETGRMTGLGIVAQETLVVALFIVRRRANYTTRNPIAWIATGIGAFGALALRPSTADMGTYATIGATIQLIAAAGYVGSLGFLGRSFGVVPAHRGIRTSGPYRWVRHPVYACYFVANLGYLIENPTLWNAAVILVQGAFQVVRIVHEEGVLSSDPEYVAYRERVRWRLLPGLY